MIIQSGHSALTYNSPSSRNTLQQGVDIEKFSLTSEKKISDQVTLSSSAKALGATESPTVQARTPVQEHLLRAAKSDRDSAEKIAYDMTVAPSAILYSSIYDMDAEGKLNKLASSGRVIDTNFRDSFSHIASIVDMQRREIYESEKAKGTDPVKIISMMIDHTNSQSRDYLEATGVLWKNAEKS